jgi:hypothetical protein
MQGSGVETLYIHKWSKVTNWNYLMLSSVKNMRGMYARQKLPADMANYALKQTYENMIHKLSSKTPLVLTEEISKFHHEVATL